MPLSAVLKNSSLVLAGLLHTEGIFGCSGVRNTEHALLEHSFIPKEHQSLSWRSPKLGNQANTIKIRIHTSVMDKVLEYCTP